MNTFRPLHVLIACEYSGRVRDAFTRQGHIAVSCDLLPTESPGAHYRGDVRELLRMHWDILIGFPPCTYVCGSGLHWNARTPGRAEKSKEAIEFFRLLWSANVEKIALENPVGILSTAIRKPDQVVQPWQFGHPESKATCLWLKSLRPLVPTKVLPLPECGHWENQTRSGQNKLGPGKDRAKLRSLTYSGIAEAMAAQWG